MPDRSKIYPQLYPEITDWPIYQLYQERDNFVTEIDTRTVQNLLERYGDVIDKSIARTSYLELIRLKENPWKTDPPNEKQFWRRVRKELAENSKHRPDIKLDKDTELLRRIVHRYSQEIAGNFNLKTFRFARKFLTMFFRRLLNTAASRNYRRIWGTKYNLYERLQLYGDIEEVRRCFAQGTVVIVPTHFSNLDSVLIGYALDAMAGLPSFSYGAGLNLYDSELIAYFMGRLGAYRVDRRKRNPIYLETLKTMSNLSLQHGVNSLFFPGGTRSRSGSLEKDLKMGLLSSLVEAQRCTYEQGEDQKIIIIPLVISYHFVLEARLLIEQYLERKGEENYLARDEFQNARKILKFAWQFFSQSSDIVLSFGQPMDVMGNRIDQDGNSMDKRGGAASIIEYFSTNGKVEADKQREAVYTRHLGKQIIESYHRNNVVLTSHVVAFSAFELLTHLYPDLDLFGIIRLPPDEFTFDRILLKEIVHQVITQLNEKVARSLVKMEDKIYILDEESMINDGIKKLGTYHTQKPLLVNKHGLVVSQSFKLLLYYHNRLDNYELSEGLRWDQELVRDALEVADL